MSFFDNKSIIKRPREHIGLVLYPTFNENNLKFTTIHQSEINRPDKISYRLYGRDDLSWVLNLVNKFDHGIKEYVVKRKIKYPSINDLQVRGII